jgi:mannose-6-phosphate isomerase-like protein (cupin superfamily)
LFYVLEGQFLFLVGERQVSASPGTFVFIPRGTVHAAKVIGTEPGKVVAAYVPGAKSDPSRSSVSYQPTLWLRNTTLSS